MRRTSSRPRFPPRFPPRTLVSGLITVVSAALALFVPPPATIEAQYFGRNKVRYDDFVFRVLRTDHLDMYYYYEAQAYQAIQDFGRMSERWYDRLARTFQHEFEQRKPIEFERRSMERIPVMSAGASPRANLLGRLVLEFHYAYPFQRPEASGQFGFQISPGW